MIFGKLWTAHSFSIYPVLLRLSLAAVFFISMIGQPIQTVIAAPAGTALQFNGSSQYLTFGPASGLSLLGSRVFTLEAWLKKTGAGSPTSTGTGGITAVPIITKGRGEAENSNVDMNYFLGIDATGVLAADFEECAVSQFNCPITSTNSDADGGGQNFPAKASTVIQNNIWYHVAVTYDGQYWRFYLNGVQDGPTTDTGASRLPRWDSLQHASVGTAMNSAGAPAGYFQGSIDEVRIWNVVRSEGEIQADMYSELTSGTGLIGRWGLNEGTGISATNSISGRPNGTWKPESIIPPSAWVPGFPIPDTTPPSAPTGLTATGIVGGINVAWTAPADADIAGYNIFRSTSSPVVLASPINGGSLVTDTSYQDITTTFGQNYYYSVSAVDTSTNASPGSTEAVGTQGAACIQFDGTNDYVTFGSTSGLGVSTFTLETWFNWSGAGATTTSGSGGLTAAIPLVTKGRGEGDGSNLDMNFFMGISGGKLAADFEDMATGLNHPITAGTTITTGVWHHAAAIYDGTTWRLYLDGILDGMQTVGNFTPRSDSIQHAGLATAMTSTGVTAGFFAGRIDEARIWNVARTEGEIRATINQELTSGTGLIARWGMDEGRSTSIASSVSTFAGTLTNGPVWGAGAPFNIAFDTTPPAAPTGLTATPIAGAIQLSWTANSESDLAGYNVYRSATSPVTLGTTLNSSLLTDPAYLDFGAVQGAPSYYAITAVDDNANESVLSAEAIAAPLPADALDLGTNHAYVNLGDYADIATFTLETWLRRDGAGVAESTGTGGIDLIPIIANGTSEAETAVADINYIFGIQNSGILCADFEEAQTGTTPGSNHPICGTHPLTTGTWYHAAATYDGTTWNLYLNGNLEATLAVGRPVNTANSSSLSFGAAMLSSGTPDAGYFDGALDEIRVWNYARTQVEITATINSKITTPQTGLLGRWGLDESSGETVNDTSGNNITGTLSGTGYSWIAGAPFNVSVNMPPSVPTLGAPANGADGVVVPTPLSVAIADPEGQPLNVTFYGRQVQGAAGPDFTIAVIPDTQYYAATYPTIFNSQMQWIADHRVEDNIVFVGSLGDTVDTAATISQWITADTAWDIIDSTGIPYGVAAGNHDGAPSDTVNFNTYFGSGRYSGKAFYGGHYGTDNDNSYVQFSASGMDFIAVFIEYDAAMTSTTHEVLQWANGILQENSARRAIVISHNMLQGGTSNSFSPQGQIIYDALKANPNLFLIMGGHLDVAARRSDTFNGHTVYTLRSDYQSADSQQSGYLRLMRFSPGSDTIYVRTYSPYQNKDYDKTDVADNNFSLPYDMEGSPFLSLGTVAGVASGGTATFNWTGLQYYSDYEWYAVVSDGTHQMTSPIWSFKTQNDPTAVTVSSFAGSASVGTVHLTWETATESNLIGFNLYRSTTMDGEKEILNNSLIPAQNTGQMIGASYQYSNATEPGQQRYYWLEIIMNDGSTELLGPIIPLVQDKRVLLPLLIR